MPISFHPTAGTARSPYFGRLPQQVKVVEVGPRDGLQNEKVDIATATKVRFIQQLAAAGLKNIEAASFVHPKVTQMADAEAVIAGIGELPGVTISALAPNLRGLDRAHAAGVKRIAVFTAASETFTQKNINMSIDQSLAVYQELIPQAHRLGMTVRAYISTAFVCPYEGDIDKARVRDIAEKLLALGADEISIGDTIGAASPKDVHDVVSYLLETIPAEKLALHFHDTYGTALANVYAGLELGIATYDSSAGGLGGCPYAPGASGNLATEDLLYMLHRMDIQTGVDLEKVAEASRGIEAVLGHPLPSRQLQRLSQQSVKCG